ncbi:hypothetical protein ACFQZX_07880 [Mucilaginibacter litoreus]|uniref:Transcriptional regulator n=1 Tax=Mucilaginibacter litoreus TaxID=1048221 RepID=A0ABW3ATC9_9SPHI
MSKLLKYIFLLFTVLATTGYESFAQVSNFRSTTKSQLTPEARARRVKVQKKLVAARNRFISQQLSLTDDESRKFWPVYNRYQEELTAVKILKRLNNSSASTNGTEQIDKEIEYDRQLVEIRKKYRDEFLKILSPEKVSELYKSESEFNHELIKQLSERSVRAGN